MEHPGCQPRAPNCQLQSSGIWHQSRTLEVGLEPGEPEAMCQLAEGGLGWGASGGRGVVRPGEREHLSAGERRRDSSTFPVTSPSSPLIPNSLQCHLSGDLESTGK